MKRFVCYSVITILFLGFFTGVSFGAVFQDPLQLYSTNIPKQWVYQAKRSSEELVVFYGQAEQELLYFEHLGTLSDQDVQEFAERSLALYEAPGGLLDFRIEKPLQPLEVAGVKGLYCVYSYSTAGGTRLWEQRIFFLLEQQIGFSIALGGGEGLGVEQHPVLAKILNHWRWLF